MRLICLLLLSVLALHADEAISGLALTTRGIVHRGLFSIAADGVNTGSASLSWSDIAVLALPRTPARAIDGGVVTRAGEILRGQPLDLANGMLQWTCDLQGMRSQPLDQLAGILLGPVNCEALPGLLAGEPGVVLANGERLSGTMTYLNAEGIGLDTGRRVAQLSRGRVALVLLRPVEPAAAQPRTWMQLVTGDRVLLGGAIAPAPQAVIAAWRDGPGLIQLALTPPRRAQATERLGLVLPIRLGSGFPAKVGGLAAPMGVRLPARGEIAWDCAGSSQLLAWVACPTGAEATHAAIAVHGAVVWEQTIQPGAPAVPVVVPLRGAGEVVLRTDAAADGETAHHLIDWGMPTLVR